MMSECSSCKLQGHSDFKPESDRCSLLIHIAIGFGLSSSFSVVGRWEYPSPTDPTQPPTDDQVDFEPSGGHQVSSSSSSDSSASSSSSAAERRDSSDFSSLMGSVSGQLRQTAQHGDRARASASAADEPQQESGHSRDSADGGDAPTAVADADSTEPESTAEAVTQHQTDADVSSDTDHLGNPAGTPETAVHGGVHVQEQCLQETAVPEEGGSGGDRGGAAACEHAASPADKAADEQAIAATDDTEQSDSHHVSGCAHSQGTHQPVSYTKQHSEELKEPKQSAEPGTPKQGVNSTCGSEDSTALPAQGSESSCKSSEAPCKPPGAMSPRKGGLVNVHRPAVKGYSIHRYNTGSRLTSNFLHMCAATLDKIHCNDSSSCTEAAQTVWTMLTVFHMYSMATECHSDCV